MGHLLASLADGASQIRKILAAVIGMTALPAWAGYAAAAPEARPRVIAARFSGVISPVAAEFLTEAISKAEASRSDAIVIELDTPGGLDPSMREIVKAQLGSKVPVIVYVQPSGARAASAGAFITMAGHIAAMAPGTNIGAAHPVAIGGSSPGARGEKKEEKPDKTMESKMVNDAVAYIQSIARQRGRNEAWAALAVKESAALPVAEAVRLDVVDLEAASLEALLDAVDGRKLDGFKAPLRTRGASVERLVLSRRQRMLAALSDPNVAMILMSLGAAGLFIELYSPGLVLPGVVGAVCLVLAFYSFHTLSASYAGIILLMLGFLFFLLEIKITSFGLLALSGAASILLGALMLFQHHPLGGIEVAWSVIGGVLAGLGLLTAGASYLVYQAHRRRTTTGAEGMVGAKGKALSRLAPAGKVQVQAEIWDAVAVGGEIAEGEPVVVQAVDGLTLKVKAR